MLSVRFFCFEMRGLKKCFNRGVAAVHCGYERVRAASRLYTFELYFHTDHSDNKDGFVLRLVESLPGLLQVLQQQLIAVCPP